MVTKLKQLQKVKNVKGTATPGDLCYTALVLKEDASPQFAFKFDLEINFKISEFSPPSTKILWLMYQFQLLLQGVNNANEGNISTCMLQLLPLRHGLGTLNQY